MTTAIDQPERVATPDGRPTPLSALNTEVPATLRASQRGIFPRIAAFYQKLNLVMAGMYTGVGCAGTPHSHHSYADESKQDREESLD